MVMLLMRTVGVALCWMSLSGFAAQPNVAFFYGATPPWNELRAFDIVVVNPGHDGSIAPLDATATDTQRFARVSLGKAQPGVQYPSGMQVSGTGPGSKQSFIDQSQPDWPQFFVEQIITPLWNAGYRGFYLDDLEAYQTIAKSSDERAGQQRGLIDAIRGMRKQYPDAKLIFNRGFAILPELHGEVYAVAAGSLFHGWNAAGGEYVDVSDADRKALLDELGRVRTDYHLPVIALDYMAPGGSRAAARDTARKISALGFIPWVSDGEMNELGIGAIEVMPRTVLMLYEGTGNEFDMMDHRIHRLATMPLNYLGYAAEYVDVTKPLPAEPASGRYAGIVTWFDKPQTPATVAWLDRQRRAGVKIAMLGALPFVPGSRAAGSFGLTGNDARGAPQRLTVDFKDKLIGFEAPAMPDRSAFFPLHAAKATLLLRLKSDRSDTMDAAALTEWGGYVLSPYELRTLPADAGDRWIVQPIEFFKRALALPAMPVPDVTTENGRRLMMVHIDGDGFVNLAERAGTPFSGTVVLNDLLKKYRIPQSVSVIQGEIGPTGLHPAESAQLEDIARRIFALPYVEIASHTYSHPFRWAEAATNADTEAYHLDIPGYKFSLEKEIDGSIDYINSRLAPKGKRVTMVFWTGDSNPGRRALELAYKKGVLNFNGGDTTITRRNNSLTRVAPIGLPQGPYYQVFAPNQNENVYTGLWTGPFYGFERVIETFELTDAPYRLKPIDIYYHFYAASKFASLQALHKVYRWALAQPVMNVYASEYARKVLDFRNMVVARTADGWTIRGNGSLRELRVPAEMGMPDMTQSDGIVGYQDHGSVRYVHMAGPQASLRLVPQAPTAPYLVDANGRVSRWQQDGSTTHIDLEAYVPLRFTLGNASGCAVTADGKALSGAAERGITRYTLDRNSAKISIACRGG